MRYPSHVQLSPYFLPRPLPSSFVSNLSPPPLTDPRSTVSNRVSSAPGRLSEHQRVEPQHQAVSRTENVTSIDIDNRSASLIRRFGALYSHGRAEAMAALDALPELRNSEELKSKLLFSVVVVSFTDGTGYFRTKVPISE